MPLSYYPNNPDFNEAAILLDMMSTDQIRKVVHLINSRGSSVIIDIKSRNKYSGGGISPLAILDSKFIPVESAEDVAIGLNCVLLAAIRKPLIGIDGYESILTNAFNLTADVAKAIATKIDSEDIMGGTASDPTGAKKGFFTKWGLSIMNAVNKSINALPGAELLGLEIDQTQDYDLDVLFEWKLLGQEVRLLNERSALMTARAYIQRDLNLIQSGDVDGLSDDEIGDIEVGDLIRKVTTRSVPSNLFAGLSGISRMSAQNSKNAQRTLKAIAEKKSGTPRQQQTLANVLKGKIPKALLLASGLGAAALATKGIANMLKGSKGQGDADDASLEIHKSISNEYGDIVADSWLNGDIEGMMGEIENLSASDETTGDIDLDRAIEDAAGLSASGDVDELGTEVGGLFMRARANFQKRRKARRERRADRRGALNRARREADSVDMNPDEESDRPTPQPVFVPPVRPRPEYRRPTPRYVPPVEYDNSDTNDYAIPFPSEDSQFDGGSNDQADFNEY